MAGEGSPQSLPEQGRVQGAARHSKHMWLKQLASSVNLHSRACDCFHGTVTPVDPATAVQRLATLPTTRA